MSHGSNDKEDLSDIPRQRKEPRPDFSQPPPPAKLPKALQDELNKDDDSVWATLYEGEGKESTDTSLRYAAYASRIRTILLAAHRYVAYTSDIGESFRPIAHPWLVKGAYGVSWAYLAGDVAHEGYKAYCHNQRLLHPKGTSSNDTSASSNTSSSATSTAIHTATVTARNTIDAVKDLASPSAGSTAPIKIPLIEDYRAVMAQRAVFQSIASMGLPAFTIHSIVRYSGRALKDVKNTTIRTYGPIGLGLAAVPFLPFMFDKPVEEAVEWVFHKGFEVVGGPGAVKRTGIITEQVKKEL